MARFTLPGKLHLREQYELEQRLARRLRTAAKAERQGLYGEVYAELAEKNPDHPLLGEHAQIRRREIDLQSKLLAPFVDRNSRVLELGGGDGKLALRMASSVKDYSLIEASSRFLEGLKSPPNVHAIHADHPPFDLPSDSIDMAYSCHVLEHLHPDDVGDFIREFHRLLVPGGRCICVTPNRLYGPHDVSRHFDRKATGLHLKEWTYGELERVFKDAGFAPVLVLSGVDCHPRIRSVRPYVLVERLLSLTPGRLLRTLPGLLRPDWRPPFRPLEQVVLLAIRPLPRALRAGSPPK